MKVIFLGSPSFAVNVLKQLLNSAHTVVGVVCQPDKKGNRNKITSCDVKTFAQSNTLPVFDWEAVNQPQNVKTLSNLGADVLVTAAYGQILKEEILNLAPFGVINVHASLLPKFRGASPVQSAIVEEETITGVTIVKTVLKMDAGPVISSESVPILPTETADDLFEKLSMVGGKLLTKTLTDIQEGRATYTPQEESEVTYCKKIKAKDEKIDWSLPAHQVCAFVRGLSSNPGAYSFFASKRIKIYNCVLLDPPIEKPLGAGEIFYTKKQMFVFCGNGKAIAITQLQLAESKKMNISDFLNGLKVKPQKFDDEEVL